MTASFPAEYVETSKETSEPNAAAAEIPRYADTDLALSGRSVRSNPVPTSRFAAKLSSDAASIGGWQPFQHRSSRQTRDVISCSYAEGFEDKRQGTTFQPTPLLGQSRSGCSSQSVALGGTLGRWADYHDCAGYAYRVVGEKFYLNGGIPNIFHCYPVGVRDFT